MLSAHGRKGAFVIFPLSGGERGWGSDFTAFGGSEVGVKTPVVGMLVATGLKPDGAVPKTGMVAVGANENMGVGKAMLNLGSALSMLAGGDRWSGDVRGGVRGT